MFGKSIIDENSCFFSVLACVFLTVSYVASLYVWKTKLSRDHPSTIKRRFFSVSCMMLLAPFFAQYFFTEETLSRGDVYDHLGLRTSGLINASILPLLLTAILFLGPLTMQFLSGIWKLYAAISLLHEGSLLRLMFALFFSRTHLHDLNKEIAYVVVVTEPVYWVSSWQDWMWVRNQFMAPLSEEWVFRACMMPILLQCMGTMTAVFTGPLLFGIAHFHHMLEKLRSGFEFKTALMISSFQFTYTSLFGAYSAYLFVRTGHFMAPLVAHMFCNHMGFPNFGEITQFPPLQRIVIIFNFLLGFALWCFLLTRLTSPDIYDNRLYSET